MFIFLEITGNLFFEKPCPSKLPVFEDPVFKTYNSWGRIFSQFGNELFPSYAHRVKEKHKEAEAVF
jgi:hypothetical protein